MTKSKNVTFNLPLELMDKYREYARENYIQSMNAAVKEALEEYAVKIEKKILTDELSKAAKDPLFLEDLNDSMEAFEKADDEAVEEEREW